MTCQDVPQPETSAEDLCETQAQGSPFSSTATHSAEQSKASQSRTAGAADWHRQEINTYTGAASCATTSSEPSLGDSAILHRTQVVEQGTDSSVQNKQQREEQAPPSAAMQPAESCIGRPTSTAGSPFLDRLQMNKQSMSGALHQEGDPPTSAALQPPGQHPRPHSRTSGPAKILHYLEMDKQGMAGLMQPEEDVSPRPPTPERPATPSSRPTRRRNFVELSSDGSMEVMANTLRTLDWGLRDCRQSSASVQGRDGGAISFASNNRMFAPLHSMQPPFMTSVTASLATRPASASAAQPSRGVPALSWTGSMQLPLGMLSNAWHHQTAQLKPKARYNWGFDSPGNSVR